MKNKKAEILNIIDHYNPNIIIGTETWLNSNIHSSELFSPSYSVYRKDGYSGVLLAIRSDLVSEHLEVETSTESIIWIKAINSL
jgi:hypothetical protein